MFLRILLLLLVLQAASFSPTAHAKGNGHSYRVVATNKLEARAVCSALRGKLAYVSIHHWYSWSPNSIASQ
jgi:hypothetical protein